MSQLSKRIRLALATAALVALATLAQAGASFAAGLMDWPDLMRRPLPAPSQRIAYGADPLQVGELWLPAGKGPFPVVLMIHGGCWLTGVASLGIMNYAAEDLRRRGIAVWNIEYRGVDRPGGGYPGTFADVAAAADALRRIGPAHRLRIDRVVALGHSAGGHLALWLAARGRLPAASPLRTADPLPIAAVVSLGGLPDLALDRAEDRCGADVVEKLVGPPTSAHPDVYADTSPAELGPVAAPEVLISGADDPLAIPRLGALYAARLKGGEVRQIVLAHTGHVELIAPGSAA